MLEKQKRRYRRHKGVRAKICGTKECPRLCIFRSGKHIYARLIDDEKGMTLVSTSDIELRSQSKPKRKTKISRETDAKFTPHQILVGGKRETNAKILSGKIAIAFEIGKLIAKKALQKKIEKVVFDRGGYKYHGRVKALAEGARAGGLKF